MKDKLKLYLVKLLLKLVNYLIPKKKPIPYGGNTFQVEGEGWYHQQLFSVKLDLANNGFYITIKGQREGYTIDFGLPEKEAMDLMNFMGANLRQIRKQDNVKQRSRNF